MNHFAEMEWNSKWDWENIVGFGSKSIESPKKLQLAEWMIVDDTGSFNLSGGGGSDGGHISSSAKSCISDSSGNFNKKIGMSVEPLIGLRLGKRTYFENGGGGNAKKTQCKSSSQNANTPCCQVQGCNTDLSMAKEYHRKHRVCDTHSKCSKVVVGGLERRFCQQCSRFHSLSEFDEKKRSCRRRLSDHNARRRKPRQFNSSPLYGGTQQMSFLLNGSSSSCNSKFTLTTGGGGGGGGYSSKSNGDGGGTAINMPCSSISEVLSPGSKGSMISAAPEYSRALSLLSNNNSSWDSCHAAIPQASSEFWSTSTNPEIQLFKTPPYEGDFYSNMLN